MAFKRAERKKAKLRLAICGPSGSGKTYSALLIALGLGGKIAMIDTERGSGELYADLCEYDADQLNAPFSPDRYISKIREAESAGYDVLIIDSLTHAWTGEGGVLEMQDRASKGTRNSFTAWREVTPQHNALVDAILNCNMHVIVTMRTKTAYEMVEDTNASGKKVQKPVKIGLAPVQREGMDYEFTVVFDLAIDGHTASTSKDRTSLFDGKYFTPSKETGVELLEWMNSGVEPPKVVSLLESAMAAFHEIENIKHLANHWNKYQAEYRNDPSFQAILKAKDERKAELMAKQESDARNHESAA